MTPRNQFKMWSVFALEARVASFGYNAAAPETKFACGQSQFCRGSLSPVIRAAVHFALKKNTLPVAHNHFLLPQYAKGKECASLA